jgi:ParB-like chromosome segregation protein Spo0J
LSAKLSEVAGKWADATAGAERHRELLERGAQLAEQFAPPDAVFAGTVQELQDLAAAGSITQEVLDAAFGEAANKLGQARMEAAGLNEQIQGLGAAAANTMEGFRAMADARRATELAINRQAEAVNIQQQIQAAQGGGVRTAEGAFDREMRDIMRETRDTLQQLLDTTKTKPTLVVGTAELY